MTIDLKTFIQNDEAIKEGGFTGAIFLTYTLNLNFYEQIIASALDRAGCANILIIADPDGYAGALDMGVRSVTGVGRRYLCVPLPRARQGVQHAKLFFMVGPKHGRMLLGSGNLTLHGYSHNLELYSSFDYKAENDSDDARYPFIQAWQLIDQLEQDGQFPATARQQLQNIREKTPWLKIPAQEPEDFHIWHNHEQTIWDQLQRWRRAQGLINQPIKSLQVFSPYYDGDFGALRKLSDELIPSKVDLHFSPSTTNLDGKNLGKDPELLQGIELHSLMADRANPKQGKRQLHAKAMIGVESEGVWCISGSANLTRPALLKTWAHGGNLELVTFQWSTNKQAFDYLLKEPGLQIFPVEASEITITDQEPSERKAKIQSNFLLTEAIVRETKLDGKLSHKPEMHETEGILRFLRAGTSVPVQIDESLQFSVKLSSALTTAEAIQLELGTNITPYRWLDHPAELERFGARSYHARVKSQMETFEGAEKLFKELMDFLWQRVDISKYSDETVSQEKISRLGRNKNTSQNDAEAPPAPPPEAFITEEELLENLYWHVDRHSPYDRNVWGLRDLLSLVLLRLTTPTEPPEIITDTGEIDDDEVQKRQAETEKKQGKALEQLKSYLINYCKSYGRRLADPNFLENISPQLLFQNHFTLGRILLEIASRVDSFTQKDLIECFWWSWAPFVWPQAVQLEGPAVLEFIGNKQSKDVLVELWETGGLSTMAIVLILEAFRTPPNWRSGIWDKKNTLKFMAVHDWIVRVKKALGKGIFSLDEADLREAVGIRSLEALSRIQINTQPAEVENLRKQFTLLANYRLPIEEKLFPLIQLAQLHKTGHLNSEEAKKLLAVLKSHSLEQQWGKYLTNPKPIKKISESDKYCPCCFGELVISVINDLNRGNLVLCSASKDAWLYQIPDTPSQVL